MGFVIGFILGVILTALALVGVILTMYQEGQQLRQEREELIRRNENLCIKTYLPEENDRTL